MGRKKPKRTPGKPRDELLIQKRARLGKLRENSLDQELASELLPPDQLMVRAATHRTCEVRHFLGEPHVPSEVCLWLGPSFSPRPVLLLTGFDGQDQLVTRADDGRLHTLPLSGGCGCGIYKGEVRFEPEVEVSFQFTAADLNRTRLILSHLPKEGRRDPWFIAFDDYLSLTYSRTA